jgi:hypothetical protein
VSVDGRSQQRKGGQGEPKPFTNFAVFSDGLLARLKDISQLGQKFEQRAKEIEARFTNQLKYVGRASESFCVCLWDFSAQSSVSTIRVLGSWIGLRLLLNRRRRRSGSGVHEW